MPWKTKYDTQWIVLTLTFWQSSKQQSFTCTCLDRRLLICLPTQLPGPRYHFWQSCSLTRHPYTVHQKASRSAWMNSPTQTFFSTVSSSNFQLRYLQTSSNLQHNRKLCIKENSKKLERKSKWARSLYCIWIDLRIKLQQRSSISESQSHFLLIGKRGYCITSGLICIWKTKFGIVCIKNIMLSASWV